MRHCCCFTNREKVDWARRRRVVVPPYVIAAAETERQRESVPDAISSISTKRSCCRSAAPKQPAAARTIATRWNVELVLESAGCRGQHDWTSFLFMPSPAALPTVWRFEFAVVARIRLIDELATRASLAPPVPPPRRAARSIG